MKNDKRIVLCEFTPEVYDITEEEIRFTRQIMTQIDENFDFIYDFEIQTNPLDFRRFLIYIIREHRNFNSDLTNYLPLP